MDGQIKNITPSDFDHRELRGAIKASGYTESDFAKLIGVDPATLSGFLNGKTSMRANTIAKAAIALDVAFDSKRFQVLFFSLRS